MLAWAAFAKGDEAEALKQMRESADLQDKVGQGEVDIPAREMLADMLLELSPAAGRRCPNTNARSAQSPNRFNGFYTPGWRPRPRATGQRRSKFYAALLESTDSGAHSARPEFDHLKSFMAASGVAD